MLRGTCGTGKSTLANELAMRLHVPVPVLHKDDIYDSVVELVPEHHSRNRICFDFLCRFLTNVIAANATVILDYGLNKPTYPN
ncbi:AAA family ATPase [Paenibacillus konkukensis]|uniref:AAA family ATPase n=1 Tax=Paenibacillus konkukensis TaxID=2020716 RepID=UPI00201E2576|nr:AAA family ATPase [Paenibacillus konkukensis]